MELTGSAAPGIASAHDRRLPRPAHRAIQRHHRDVIAGPGSLAVRQASPSRRTSISSIAKQDSVSIRSPRIVCAPLPCRQTNPWNPAIELHGTPSADGAAPRRQSGIFDETRSRASGRGVLDDCFQPFELRDSTRVSIHLGGHRRGSSPTRSGHSVRAVPGWGLLPLVCPQDAPEDDVESSPR